VNPNKPGVLTKMFAAIDYNYKAIIIETLDIVSTTIRIENIISSYRK